MYGPLSGESIQPTRSSSGDTPPRVRHSTRSSVSSVLTRVCQEGHGGVQLKAHIQSAGLFILCFEGQGATDTEWKVRERAQGIKWTGPEGSDVFMSSTEEAST